MNADARGFRCAARLLRASQAQPDLFDFQGANAVAVRRDETIAFSWVTIHNYFWPRGEDVRRPLAVFFVTTDSSDGTDQVARLNLIRASGVIRG